MKDKHTGTPQPNYDLSRFLAAQSAVYQQVMAELRAGRKRGHWMWFIFPQLRGLGYSETARYYAISGAAEALVYLRHPVLGKRLQECTDAVIAIRGRSALDIFGPVDELKFRSSMTLFDFVSPADSRFQHALDQYFDGREDSRTIELLQGDSPN